MTVDDWGSSYIDGTKVVDLTDAIEPGGEYDADGNQTLVQTGTGIWKKRLTV